MKNVIFALAVLFLVSSCATPNKYSNFEYSYARSGGYAPIYENLLIKGHKVHYSFESKDRKVKKDFSISNDDRQKIEEALSANNFRTIREDYKKFYDNISTSISVKTGPNSGNKSDTSHIMAADRERWRNVVKVFEELIVKNTADQAAK